MDRKGVGRSGWRGIAGQGRGAVAAVAVTLAVGVLVGVGEGVRVGLGVWVASVPGVEVGLEAEGVEVTQIS